MAAYQKDFDSWNERKKILTNSREGVRYFKEREIWWTSIGVNVGSESDGKNELFERPVLILKRVGKDMFFGIPITSKIKSGPNFVQITYEGRVGTASVVDTRSISTKRLVRKLTTLPEAEFARVLVKLQELLF